MWTSIAQEAVQRYPSSDIEVALEFARHAVPAFVGTSNDRLVKAGRSLKSLVATFEGDKLEQSLLALVEECELLVSDKLKVPTVRFGKTNLDMPIVTLGCMRFQQEWGPRITNMNMIGSDCQDNLIAILKQAISYGMTHIETARGYGCSEIQLGCALKQLFLTGYCKREDLIIQTKVPPYKKAADFREALETSFRNLQMDYLDLFSFHGMNFDEQLEWTFDGEENCLTVVQEFMKAGRIKHLGFSTHGSTDLILQVIEKDVFQYVNLHYHYFGSYTASGGGRTGMGNLDCVELLREKGMGIFIISPFDKGGRIYAPSKKLRALTLPEMEPIEFKSQWIWNHHQLYDLSLPQLHTYTVGAGRPSDLDQPAVAAYRHSQQNPCTVAKLTRVVYRLDQAKEEALGKQWMENWWRGLPKAQHSAHFVEHNQIVWIYNMIKAYGLYEFARNRYGALEGNLEKWDDSKTPDENIEKIGRNSWGFVPGLALKPDVDYSDDFGCVPPENLEHVKDAEAFVVQWCGRPSEVEGKGENKKDRKIPEEWETSYDMRPWPDYPDQPSRD